MWKWMNTLSFSIRWRLPLARMCHVSSPSASAKQFRDTDSRLRSILESVGNVNELSDENQMMVFNLHQQLQGIVVGDPENYVICSRRHSVGTHFKRVSCMPAGDFKREQERTREALRQRLGAGPMPVDNT